MRDILKSIMPAILHPNQDVRNASAKILLDVHKLSGCVTDEELESLSDKARNVLQAKLKVVEIEKNLLESEGRQRQGTLGSIRAVREDDDGEQTDPAEVTATIGLGEISSSPSKLEARVAQIQDKKKIVEDKGASKDWQEREIALREMEFLFKAGKTQQEDKEILEDLFVSTCLILLKNCLEENNMAIYLQAIQVGQLFFGKALGSEVVLGSLQGLIEPIILRTTDTNTRIRKKSVDLVY